MCELLSLGQPRDLVVQHAATHFQTAAGSRDGSLAKLGADLGDLAQHAQVLEGRTRAGAARHDSQGDGHAQHHDGGGDRSKDLG
ncbi:hypothetical protein SDC9_199093 [bioreactor metagenome]|uniref:Uncharacterized protein n=1 Tax=bioreactor metagenome TaxID=1076179 RepID=A0A645IJJ1_9ZZZZ